MLASKALVIDSQRVFNHNKVTITHTSENKPTSNIAKKNNHTGFYTFITLLKASRLKVSLVRRRFILVKTQVTNACARMFNVFGLPLL